MKKAQILSAVALALALGVVIPAAGASVSVYALNATEEADILSINEKLSKIYDGLGTLITYDANKVQTRNTRWDAYDKYDAYNGAIVRAQDALNAVENQAVSVNGSAAAQLKVAVNNVIQNNSGVYFIDILNASDDINVLINSDAWKATGTFNDIKDIATQIRDKLNTKISSLKYATSDQEYRNRLEGYRDDLNEVLAGADNILDTELNSVAATHAATIAATYQALTGDAITINNAAELKSAIKAVEGKLPQLSYFRRVVQSIVNLAYMKNHIEDYSHREVEFQLEEADKAMAGSISTADPIVTPDDNTTLKPGNTGLVGSAEGTATTVSIVAGLATALTALGAGVVVYRNARREK